MKGKIVILNQDYNRIVCPDMATWIKKNKDVRFYVENCNETSAKLKGVFFRVTFDLLIVVETKEKK